MGLDRCGHPRHGLDRRWGCVVATGSARLATAQAITALAAAIRRRRPRYDLSGIKSASTRLAANRGSPTVAQAMRPRWGKANGRGERRDRPTEEARARSIEVEAAVAGGLERIYGPHGLSFYSHVRPKPSSTEEREAEEQRSNDEAADEDRRTRRSG
jgi:hypothetical protein